MATKSHRPGGGIKSRVNVSVGQRLGSGSKAINHAGVAQIGQRQGNHFTEPGRDGRMQSRYGGVDMYSAGPGFNKVKYGNEVAKNVGGGGPGTGRTIYASGSQCRTGAADPGNTPQAKTLWPGWERK